MRQPGDAGGGGGGPPGGGAPPDPSQEPPARMSAFDPISDVGRGMLSAADVVRAAGSMLRLSGDFDESKVNRDGGKFAEKPSRAVGMASPSKEEGVDLEQAFKDLQSRRFKDFLELQNDIDKALGMQTDRASVVGGWGGSAEGSTITDFREYRDFEEVRYAMAITGLLAEQKAVIAFEESADGRSHIYRASVDTTIDDLRETLDRTGIPDCSIAQVEGGLLLVVYHDAAEVSHQGRSELIEKLGSNYSVKFEDIRGEGEYIGVGSDSDRGEADAEYLRLIERYEENFPDRPRYARRTRLSWVRLGSDADQSRKASQNDRAIAGLSLGIARVGQR